MKNKNNKLHTKNGNADASKESSNTSITPDSDASKTVQSDQPNSPSKTKKKMGKKNNSTTTPAAEGETLEEETNEKKNFKRQKQKFQGYTLFIGNLSYDTKKEDLLNHFAKCGPIKTVRLPLEKDTNKPRGFAYLEVEDHVTYEVKAGVLSLKY